MYGVAVATNANGPVQGAVADYRERRKPPPILHREQAK
jgi:hypothetical protein